MHPFDAFREQVAAAAAEALGVLMAEAESLLELPKGGQADLALPCFKLAAGKKPAAVAVAAAKLIKRDRYIASVEADGPYLNFFANWPEIAAELVPALRKGVALPQSGRGKTMVVDYSHPNIAKPMHVGHLRSTIIGDAIANFYQALGWKVVRWNYLGDYGTQFGKLVVAFRKWGDEAELAKRPIPHLLSIYVKFHEAAAADPALDEEARKAFKSLENGDRAVLKLWERFVTESKRVFEATYGLLGVRFDTFEGESTVQAEAKALVEEAVNAGVAKESDKGGIIVSLEPLPPLLIQKSDEATLYATRDLAMLRKRIEHAGADRVVYVVGSEQKLYFQQVFATAELMGITKPQQAVHVEYGLMTLPEGKMSTRTGNVVFLEELLHEAVQRAERVIEEKNPELADKAAVARMVGIGAVKYNDLCTDRIKNVTFTWERALAFDGDTAPYLQYSHARAASILRKAGKMPAQFDASALREPAELELVRLLARFTADVKLAAELYKPHVLANSLYRLAVAFSEFYGSVRVLEAPEAQKAARLALTEAYKSTLACGLKLLGIEAPEQM